MVKFRSIIPPISTKQTIISHLKPLNKEKTTTYCAGNPCPAVGHKYVSGLN
jgi:hypothetical protein